MYRKTRLACPLVGALILAGCSASPQTMLSPSPVEAEATFLNADGSALKVFAPRDLGPAEGIVVDSVRPTLGFTSSVGRLQIVSLEHEIEVVNANGSVVYSRMVPASAASSTHTLESDLSYADSFTWRARARLAEQTGPWSAPASFRTPDRPGPAAPIPGGPLPFPVPAACGPFGPTDRTGCVLAMTSVSPWWAACQGGSGTNCHRFTRSVAAAMAVSDPGWGLLSKNPGEQQCSWNSCGSGNGSGYGEDVVAHHDGATLRAWDIVGGAGAPGAQAGWSRISSFRSGNNWAPVPPLGSN